MCMLVLGHLPVDCTVSPSIILNSLESHKIVSQIQSDKIIKS